jgi:N-acetylmuramoyl-L-alanine amidase
MHKKVSFIFLFLYVIQLVFSENQIIKENNTEEYDISGNIMRFMDDDREVIFGNGFPYILVDGKFIYTEALVKDKDDFVVNKILEEKKVRIDNEKNEDVAEKKIVEGVGKNQEEIKKSKEGKKVSQNLGEVYLHEMKPDKILINAIVIDAGHGGKDAGAFRGNLLEKNVTLKISKKVNELLGKKFPNKKIILTRDKDVFLSLDKRSEIANNVSIKYGSSIFVSIHVNASKSQRAYGFETWYIVDSYKRNVIEKGKVSHDKDISSILNSMINEELYEESKNFAIKVQNALDRKIGNETLNRGVKENVYFVVKNSFMPAILVEVGFLSNKREANQLTNETYLNKLATGIVDGIGEFINEYEKYNDKK